MLEQLLTEQRNPASTDIGDQPTEGILRIINAEDHKVAAAVETQIPIISRAVDAIVAAIKKGGRLFYIGAGTSGRLAILDAAECPPTFSVPEAMVQAVMAGGANSLVRATEASEDDAESGRQDLLGRGFASADVLVGIAASGRTPYVLGAVSAAHELGATTVGISCSAASELSSVVDFAIEALVGPEVVTGSTRMKAGTATKLILNMISTAVMIRLGHVYENLMVNVQPKNAKLEDRATRIIVDACGVGYGTAAELLVVSGKNVKTAIVMSRLSLEREAAERRLAAVGGRISEALKR